MVNKTISLSSWMIEKLKGEINASGLIERVLREHYQMQPKEIQKLEEKEKELAEERHKKLIEVHENFFGNNEGATEESFAKFMAGCSDETKLKCGLELG